MKQHQSALRRLSGLVKKEEKKTKPKNCSPLSSYIKLSPPTTQTNKELTPPSSLSSPFSTHKTPANKQKSVHFLLLFKPFHQIVLSFFPHHLGDHLSRSLDSSRHAIPKPQKCKD
jgi:hypothetical protein